MLHHEKPWAMPCKEIPYHVAECHQRWRKRGNWILMVQLHTLYRVKSSSLWDRIPRLLHFLGCIQSCLFNPPSFWQIQFLSILDSCSINAYSSWWRGKYMELDGITSHIWRSPCLLNQLCEGWELHQTDAAYTAGWRQLWIVCYEIYQGQSSAIWRRLIGSPIVWYFMLDSMIITQCRSMVQPCSIIVRQNLAGHWNKYPILKVEASRVFAAKATWNITGLVGMLIELLNAL